MDRLVGLKPVRVSSNRHIYFAKNKLEKWGDRDLLVTDPRGDKVLGCINMGIIENALASGVPYDAKLKELNYYQPLTAKPGEKREQLLDSAVKATKMGHSLFVTQDVESLKMYKREITPTQVLRMYDK